VSEDNRGVLNGEVLGPARREDLDNFLAKQLDLPAGMQVGLPLAVMGRLRAWGVKRTIDAYRQVMESQLATMQVRRAQYEAGIEVIKAQERWKHADSYREAARNEAEAHLERAREARLLAEAARLESEERVQAARDRRDASEIVRLIERNNLEAEKAEAERRRLEAEMQLADAKDGSGNSAFRKKLRALETAKRDYDELMASKAAHEAEYGGAENMPAYLRTLYENLEDDLAFRSP
jgi:hypothetical protein